MKFDIIDFIKLCITAAAVVLFTWMFLFAVKAFVTFLNI